MYLLEGLQSIMVKYELGYGDVMLFAKQNGGDYIFCGRKATKVKIISNDDDNNNNNNNNSINTNIINNINNKFKIIVLIIK